MPEVDASGRLDTWTYEDRNTYRQKQIDQVRQIANSILPSILEGNTSQALEQLHAAVQAVQPPQTPTFMKTTGTNLQQKWSQPGGNPGDYRLDFNYTLPDQSPPQQGGWKTGFGDGQGGSGSNWLDDVASGVRNAVKGTYSALTHPIQSPEEMAPDFLSSLGGKAAIRSVAAAVGAPAPKLTGALGTVADVAASPLNLIGVGEAGNAAQAGWRAALKAGVQQIGKNEAAGLTGLGAQQGANTGLGKLANSDVPVLSDVAGNPIVRAALPAVAGLAGGAAGYKAAENPAGALRTAERVPEAVGNVAARAGIVPEGAVPGAGMVHVDQPQAQSYIDALTRNNIEWRVSPDGTIEVTDPAHAEQVAETLTRDAMGNMGNIEGDRSPGDRSFESGAWNAFGGDVRTQQERNQTYEDMIRGRGLKSGARPPGGSPGDFQSLDDAERISEILDPETYANPTMEAARSPLPATTQFRDSTPLTPDDRAALQATNKADPMNRTKAGRDATVRLATDAANTDANALAAAGYSERALAYRLDMAIKDHQIVYGTKDTAPSLQERAYRNRLRELAASLSDNGPDALDNVPNESATSAGVVSAGAPGTGTPVGSSAAGGGYPGTVGAVGGETTVKRPDLFGNATEAELNGIRQTHGAMPEAAAADSGGIGDVPPPPGSNGAQPLPPGDEGPGTTNAATLREQVRQQTQRGGYETTDSAGRTRVVPPVGTHGASAAVQVANAVDRAPGKLFSALPAWVKNPTAFVANPSLTMDRPVLNAWRARAAVKAQLQTRFAASLRPQVDAILQAVKEDPPEYTGPKLGETYQAKTLLGKTVTKTVNAGQDALIGTVKDIAERPEMYRMSAKVRRALDQYDRTAWDEVASVARSQYGVEVHPYTANGKPGYVHLPTVESKDLEDAVENYAAATSRTGTTAGAKPRVYDTAWERVAANPDFVPETNLANLADVHVQGMAQNAANSTLKTGANGLTKMAVLEAEHPGLREAKDTARARLTSLKGKLDTLDSQMRGYATNGRRLAAQQAKIEARMEPLQARVDGLGEDYGPELSYLSGQVRELQMQAATLASKQEAAGGKAALNFKDQATLGKAAAKAQDELSTLVKAYANASIDRRRFAFDPVTNRYYPPEAAKTMSSLMTPLGPTATKFNELMQEIRGTHLAGDTSPFTIQDALGVFASPKNAARSVVRMFGENPRAALQRIARDESGDVAEYTQATRRPFGDVGMEFQVKGGTDYRGVGRIPIGKGKKWGDIEENMFAITQRLSYEQWKHDRDTLLRRNPDMPPEVAAHDAASVLSKVIPNLDPTERGLSPTRAMAERTLLTSTSFATSPALLMADATKGMTKLMAARTLDPGTAWRSLSGREQLAIERVLTTAATVGTISAASAVLSAQSRHMDPVDALKESFDPHSGMFMALQLGGGRRVGIGGPMRSFVKALVPQSYNGDNWIPLAGMVDFAKQKLNSPIGAAVDLVRNQDFFDNKIRDGSPLHQLVQSLWYGTEQGVAPIAVGQAGEQVRQGQTSPSQMAQGIGGQFLGVNYTPPSPTEQLNQIARSRGYDSYAAAPPAIQKSIQQGNASLWQQKIDASDAATQKYYAVKSQLLTEQTGRDADLLDGKITLQQWQATVHDAQTKLSQAGADMFGSENREPRNAADRYYQEIDKDTTNGITDWDAVDAWKAAQPATDQKFIDENTGINGTSLQKLRSSLLDAYYKIPKYDGVPNTLATQVDAAYQDIANVAGSTTDTKMLAALNNSGQFRTLKPAVRDLVKRKIVGLLKETGARASWAQAHPEFAIVYGKGALAPDAKAAIKRRLQSSSNPNQ